MRTAPLVGADPGDGRRPSVLLEHGGRRGGPPWPIEESFGRGQYRAPEASEEGDRGSTCTPFDKGVAEARDILAKTSGETLMEDWSMKMGGEITMTLPKAAVVRSFIFSHNVHHRAQLGVYLRLLDVPVPGHYGPTADEKM